MDTGTTEEQQALLDSSIRFCEQTYPIAKVREGAYADPEFARAYRRQAAELGWFSMLVPHELGGGSLSGNGMLDAALIAYHRGRLLQPGPFVGTNVVADALCRVGNGRQRIDVVADLVSGERSAAWTDTTPRAHEHGDLPRAVTRPGGFELSGSITLVHDIDETSWLLVTAGTDEGMSQFLVPPGAPGVTISRCGALDLTRHFCSVHFDGVELDESDLVGILGNADTDVAHQLAVACTLTVAESVGSMATELEMTVQYAKDRIAFGRPIGSFQAIKHLLADTSLLVEMSKGLALAAAQHVGESTGYGLEASSMAKAFVADAGIELAQNCFQVFAGIGFTWEHDQHLYLRRLTTDSMLFGDASWHRERLCVLAGI